MQKVVVITGASSGLGKELAKLYLVKNYQLVLTGRKKEGFAEFDKNKNVEIILGDLRKTEVIERIAKVVNEKYKRLDTLINNAGAIYLNPIEENTEKIIEELLSIHIKAPMLLTQKLLWLMKKQKSGKIINIISTSGKKGNPNSTAYCAAKFGLDGFTKALRAEVKKHNIQVIAVYPGGTKTHLFDKYLNRGLDTSSYMDPKKVAEIVVYLSETEGVSPEEIVINRLSK